MWEHGNKKSAITAVLLVLGLLIGVMIVPQAILAQETSEAVEEEPDVDQTDIPEQPTAVSQLTVYQRGITYPEYLAVHPEIVRPDKDITIPAFRYVDATADVELLHNFSGSRGVSVKIGERGYVEWEFEVEEAGYYNIAIDYHQVEGRSSSIERGIEINGEKPFAEAGFLTLFRVWGNEGPVEIDIYGNHLRPRQVEKPIWQSVTLSDPLGYEAEPFLFYFEPGINSIRLVSVAEEMIVHQIRLFQSEKPVEYHQVLDHYQALGYEHTENVFIKIQAEEAIYRAGPTIMPEHDMGDPTVEPYHPAEIRMNSLGGHRWKHVGEWATWEFDVPTTGLYQIVIKGKQDQRRGIYSNRRLLIDGKVPFIEADALQFPFNSYYNMIGPETEDGEPALVALEEGKHILKLEVVLGEVADVLRRTEEALYDLNTIYRRIIMITSGQPDPLRSYQLEDRIPGLIDALLEQANVLRNIADEFETITGQRGGHTAVLTTFAIQLEDMAARPYAIPGMIQEYRDNVGALGTWMNQTIEQPLQIDYIIIASPEQEIPDSQPTTVQKLTHEVKAFIASFTYDYKRVGDRGTFSKDDEVLRVWIGAGRDQAQVLKQLIEDSFTPQTGIPVDLELIQEMDKLLIPSFIAGTAPDVALGAANMDLAFRGALVDLSEFEDFEQISERFMRSAFLPFRFRDAVYALPEVQGYNMMFYRKDVLAEMGLEVPQTWDDVYRIIPELQKENMEFGLKPQMDTYQMFLYQKGVPLFKEDVVATNLDSETAVQTFRELTDLYTLHTLLIEYNDANRFRLGEMPLLIANYGLYNTLSIFAPELRGEWGMALIPGTMQEDGTINRTIPVAGTVVPPGAVAVPPGTSGAVMLSNSERKDIAWEFMKWWTSSEIQSRFGRDMESLMGAAARYATANVQAFTELPWNAEERDTLLEQWEWVEGVPAVLGSYYVNRQFDWLFRAIVLNNEPLRESILEYDRAINEEIARKRAEFNLETSVDELSEELKDLYWSHYTHLKR